MEHTSNLRWHKSSFSGSNGNCVEVARQGELFWVRSTRDREGPVVAFTRAEWDAFTQGAHAGELDAENL